MNGHSKDAVLTRAEFSQEMVRELSLRDDLNKNESKEQNDAVTEGGAASEVLDAMSRFDFVKPSGAEASTLAEAIAALAGDGPLVLRGGSRTNAFASTFRLSPKLLENLVYAGSGAGGNAVPVDAAAEQARAELCAVVMLKLVRALLLADVRTLRRALGHYNLPAGVTTTVNDPASAAPSHGGGGSPNADLSTGEERLDAYLSQHGAGTGTADRGVGPTDGDDEVWAEEEDLDDFDFQDGHSGQSQHRPSQSHHHHSETALANGNGRAPADQAPPQQVHSSAHSSSAHSSAAALRACLCDVISHVCYSPLADLDSRQWQRLGLTEEISRIVAALRSGDSSGSSGSSSGSSSVPLLQQQQDEGESAEATDAGATPADLSREWARFFFLLRDRAIHKPESASDVLPLVLALLQDFSLPAAFATGAFIAAGMRQHGGVRTLLVARYQDAGMALLALSSVCESADFSISLSSGERTSGARAVNWSVLQLLLRDALPALAACAETTADFLDAATRRSARGVTEETAGLTDVTAALLRVLDHYAGRTSDGRFLPMPAPGVASSGCFRALVRLAAAAAAAAAAAGDAPNGGATDLLDDVLSLAAVLAAQDAELAAFALRVPPLLSVATSEGYARRCPADALLWAVVLLSAADAAAAAAAPAGAAPEDSLVGIAGAALKAGCDWLLAPDMFAVGESAAEAAALTAAVMALWSARSDADVQQLARATRLLACLHRRFKQWLRGSLPHRAISNSELLALIARGSLLEGFRLLQAALQLRGGGGGGSGSGSGGVGDGEAKEGGEADEKAAAKALARVNAFVEVRLSLKMFLAQDSAKAD